MDFWQRARTFAEVAAKRSQELTMEAAKKSQDHITMIGSSSAKARLSDIVSEASRKSKEIAAEASRKSMEIAAEASKRADQIKAEALKRADLIKSQIPTSAAATLSSLVVDVSSSMAVDTAADVVEDGELERFGVTEELREFVKGITSNTFRDFPLEDDAEMSDIPTVSNVRQDLTAWQEKHAKLVLLTVKEISKLRYELCPRVMKERKFWRIYFILVNSHVSPYENRYMEEAKQNSAEQVEGKMKETATGGTSKTAAGGMNQKIKTSSTTAQEDLDVFLLGDLGDSDDAPEEGDEGLDDDFDKI